MDPMIGVRIKNRRKQLHLSGTKIKELTGISTGNLSDIETGKSLPSCIALINLSKALDCSVDYILFGESRESECTENSSFRAENTLLEYFRKLSEDDQDEIIAIAKFKVERQKERKKVPPTLSNSAGSMAETA